VVSVTGTPLREEDGRIARWYLLLTDIEDRKPNELYKLKKTVSA